MFKVWSIVMSFVAGVGIGMLITIYRQIVMGRIARNSFERWFQSPDYPTRIVMVLLGLALVSYLVKIVFSIMAQVLFVG